MSRVNAARFSNAQHLAHLTIFAISNLTKGEINKTDVEIPFQSNCDIFINKLIPNIAFYESECSLNILCNLDNSCGYLLRI